MKGLCAAALAAMLGATSSAGAADLGPETNLPLPRFVSLKSSKANIRRGPGLTHRIDWVFLRRGMPLEVIAEHGLWRKVRDVDAATGWVHHAMLRGSRSAVVMSERAALREDPAPNARKVAIAEGGAILALSRCEGEWCEAGKDGLEGWILKSDLWGVAPEEAFD